MTLKQDVQHHEQQDANSETAGAGDGASASLAVPHTDPEPSGKRTGRDRGGRFARGNRASLKHGRFSQAVARALLPEQREVLAMFAEHEAGLIADLGGESELSTFERDLVRKYEQIDAIAEFNAARLLSPRAAVRREARDTFMAAISQQLKIIGMLGLQRRAKTIDDMSLTDYLSQTEHHTHTPKEEHNHGAAPIDHGRDTDRPDATHDDQH